MKRHLFHGFSDVWMTNTGRKVRVSMQDAPDVSQEADFIPRRIAVIERITDISPGTVITRGLTAYLLVAQGELEHVFRFRAFLITNRMKWTRKGATIHPVTGMETEGSPVTMDPALPVAVEPLRSIRDLGVERPKQAIFTGAAVEVGDIVGPYEVHNVVHLLGVRQLEAY